MPGFLFANRPDDLAVCPVHHGSVQQGKVNACGVFRVVPQCLADDRQGDALALGDAGPTVPAHIERELDGTSCHPADFLQLAVHSVRGVQVYYSLLNRDFEWELMPLGIDQQVGSIIWSPLAAGRLGGCYRRNNSMPQDGRVARGGAPVRDNVVAYDRLYNIIDVLDEVAAETGKAVAQVALNWLLQRPTVCSLVIGASSEEQLRQNLGAVDWKLTAEQMQRLDAALVAVGICLQGCTTSYAKDREDAKETPAGERLEISFRFQRGGIASSQYAIWIEDETGKLVRTLYVTSFTAKGGYEYRKDAVPTWVAKADPKNRISGNIDAFTGATPRNGTLHYVWDGKNNEGMPVSKGTYMVFIEGTLYWESRVVFSAKLHWGSCEEESVLVSSRYYGAPSVNKDMITDLKVFHMAK